LPISRLYDLTIPVSMLLHCGSRTLDLSTPIVMGVLNVTPDSFSDGGLWFDSSRAIERALQMVAEGAGIIDVGGESTRPGAVEVPVEEELRRVLPVIAALAPRVGVPVSVDTSRPEVIRAAVDAGATLINDIRGLRVPGALAAVASTSAAVCVMHMQGEPRTMQTEPTYSDVVAEVSQFLIERVAACESAGIARERICLDPGIGFGKRVEHNLALLAHIPDLLRLRLPLLIGVSRKSLIGVVTGKPVEQRLLGGVAFATAAVLSGASIIRAHDVAATVDAIKVATALRNAGYQS
jgi:dihydropteroate synthase